jgi:hypothetical protein
MEESYTRKPDAPGLYDGDRPPGATSADRPTEASARTRQPVGSLAAEAKEQGKAALARGKDSTAAQIENVADSLHATANQLKEHDQQQAGRFLDYAAERLDTFSRRLRDNDLDALIEDAARIGRKSPVTLFAGSVAAGFLLSRFVKSSAKPKTRTPPTGRASESARREPVAAASPRESDRPGAPVNSTGNNPARGPGASPGAPAGDPFPTGRSA